jgi:hypothetical protein
MVGQVLRSQMAGLAWWEFAISRLAKGFVTTAAVTFASVAVMTAPAMMSQASAQWNLEGNRLRSRLQMENMK